MIAERLVEALQENSGEDFQSDSQGHSSRGVFYQGVYFTRGAFYRGSGGG